MDKKTIKDRVDRKRHPLYYHVTDRKSAEAILKEGLLPRRGKNSLLCGEERNMVYLCEREDIPYWKIILGADTVLRIDFRCRGAGHPQSWIEGAIEEYKYSRYSEYLLDRPIPPEMICISRAGGTANAYNAAMRSLCESYVYSLGLMCAKIARIIRAEESRSPQQDIMQDEDIRNIRAEITCMAEVVEKRLDGYRTAASRISQAEVASASAKSAASSRCRITTAEDVRKWIQESAREEIAAITDHYCSDDARLYEKIAECRTVGKEAKNLSRVIRNVFTPFLDGLETGRYFAC